MSSLDRGFPRQGHDALRLLAMLAWIGTVEAAAPPKVPLKIPPPDHVVPAWYLGMPVMHRSFELPQQYLLETQLPKEDALPWRQSLTYIVGVTDTAIGASPHQQLPTPDGKPLTMPGHQAVLSCINTPDTPTLGIAYAVVPGPRANKHNVRADSMPEHSFIGEPLATAIRIGPKWLTLTSHRTIDYGLYKGLLRLRFFGASPTGWATPNWDDNYAYMPGMAESCPARARPNRKFVVAGGPAPVVPAASMPNDIVALSVEAPLSTCSACHGENGVSVNDAIPNLAGQKYDYLRAQLLAFRNGTRIDPQMTPSARDLTDAQIDATAQHYSRLPIPPASAPNEAKTALTPTSRPLVFCVRCHGGDGVSPNDIWPNLVGQKRGYLQKQMAAYSRGERQDDMMAMWGKMVNAEQMAQILDHFSRMGGPQR